MVQGPQDLDPLKALGLAAQAPARPKAAVQAAPPKDQPADTVQLSPRAREASQARAAAPAPANAGAAEGAPASRAKALGPAVNAALQSAREPELRPDRVQQAAASLGSAAMNSPAASARLAEKLLTEI